jgi:hypothetical protein
MAAESAWCDPIEAARILGLSGRDAVYHQIDNGTIPKNAIKPRTKGGAIRINRAWLMTAGALPSNVTQFPVAAPPLTQDDMERLADMVAERVLARVFPQLVQKAS